MGAGEVATNNIASVIQTVLAAQLVTRGGILDGAVAAVPVGTTAASGAGNGNASGASAGSAATGDDPAPWATPRGVPRK
jgi:hypothetical protein